MEQKPDKEQSPLCWDSRIELKWIDFLKNDKELKRDSGILQHKTAIVFIRKFATIPREDINAADTQAALLDAIEQYGKNNEKAFTRLKDCIESYSKILLVNSRLLTASDYNYERRITSIGKANNQWSEALEQRGFVPEEDKRLLRRLLKDGEDWRNDWHHKTPPQTDTEKLAEGCKVWLRYIFAVAAISFHYNKSRGGLIFTADRNCQLTFTQPEANPGKQSTFNTLKGVPFQIDARPGGFHLEITVTEANGRSRMETRTGEIKRDEYLKINIRVGELGRGGVPRFTANPLLAGMAKPANEEGIPFQGGSYRGQTNERKLPHGIGTFIRNGISYGGRFREGKPEGSFLVKGEGFEYRGTLSFDTMPWGLDRGEMILTLTDGQRYTYKEATFRGMHCVRGNLFLDGKLLYKGEFAPPAEGMMSLPQGIGELHSTDGAIYYGEIDNAVPHGRGCLVSNSGTTATYTDWIAGESTESTDTMRRITISGDRPAWLFDGDCIVCPVSGTPLTFYYIGSPRLTLRDESGTTLTCPDTEEWNYRFGSPTAQPEPKPKPTAEPEKRTNPTAQPQPVQASGERKETSQPANEEKEQKLTIEVGNNNKLGFVNEQCHWVILPQFDGAKEFSEGLAAVKTNGKWGFIDKRGNFVIQPQYIGGNSFSYGLAQVKVGKKWGFIDKRGNFVIQPQFEDIGIPKEGICAVRPRTINSKWGFINAQGNFVTPLQFNSARDFSEGLAAVETNGKWGFIDKQGNVAIQSQFNYAFSFSEGLAAVRTNDKWGFIDKRGNFVIQPQFEYAGLCIKGICNVKLNKKWGFINKQGKFVIQPQFDNMHSFTKDKIVVSVNRECFYINHKGEHISNTQEKKSERKPGQGTAITYDGNYLTGYYPIDKYGDRVGTILSSDGIYFSENLARVSLWIKDENEPYDSHLLYGFIDRKGELVIPAKFSSANNFHEEVAAVAVKGKPLLWGIIDKSGDWVLEPKYAYIDWFEDGKASAKTVEGKRVTLTLRRE